MRALIIPLLFLIMPLAEIAAFIFVGREVGVGTTLLLVLASAVAGAAL
ncbi:MAG: FxsA family protein, partial [Pararhizobium sp.]